MRPARVRDYPARVKRLRALFVATAAAAILVGGLAVRNRRVKRFEYYGEPLAERAYAELATGGWTARSMEVTSGVALRGLARPPKTRGAPWVFFFAGNSGTLLADARRFLDALGGAENLGLAVYAYRGFDGCPGKSSRDAIFDDAVTTYTRFRSSDEVAGAKVHLVGFSLGAVIATHVTVTVKVNDAPASITLLAPPTEIDVAQPSLLSRVMPADRYETLSLLSRVTVPALVVHGDADLALPVAMGRAVKAGLGDRAKYVEVPGVGHLELLEDPRALGAVRASVIE
jgi:fermentation-respiration switch protein FrsA (DUF1100 family)